MTDQHISFIKHIAKAISALGCAIECSEKADTSAIIANAFGSIGNAMENEIEDWGIEAKK